MSLFKLIKSLIIGTYLEIHEFDLSQPVEMIFRQHEGRYLFTFWNPIRREWWTLPEHIIDGVRYYCTLDRKSITVATDCKQLSCLYTEITYYAKRFATYKDIDFYLSLLRAEYEKCETRSRELEEEMKKLPQVVHFNKSY